MPCKIIIANDKGGVGKSTLAQVCVAWLSRRGHTPRVVEYDRNGRLPRILGAGRVVSVPLPSVVGMAQDARAQSVQAWDPMIAWLTDAEPLVVDFGAQAWSQFASWAEDVMLARLCPTVPVTVLVPVTADLEALAGAQRIVDSAPRLLPGVRLALLACDKDGEVGFLRGVAACSALIQSGRDAGAALRVLPTMTREAYPALAALGMDFDAIAGSDPADLAERTGLPMTAVARTIKAVDGWFAATLAVLDAAVGEPAAVPKAEPVSRPAPEPAPEPGSAPEPEPQPAAAPAAAASGPLPRERFDETAYRRANPDVAAAVDRGEFDDGYAHYVLHGYAEGRPTGAAADGAPVAIAAPHAGIPTLQAFDEDAYLRLYPDVAAAVHDGHIASGFVHFIQLGRREGRSAPLRAP
ncbi:hypothetical protein [Azospirillum halopraeferens]|uniref:hypothetical protein n=1 Tax=Azospirillum halopraeferens TaxID=34010 RepID=UPI000687E98B|nr:hypothetical protein [Azospirillum halopraeferens]